MRCGLLSRAFLRRTFCSRDALLIPRLPCARSCFEVLSYVAIDVAVCAWVAGLIAVCGNSIVRVIGCLLPGSDDYFFIGIVGMKCGDDTPYWIVEQYRTDTSLDAEFKQVPLINKLAEERFILTYGLAF